uniref:Uncharacterized protein LOC113796783 n=1 Tax=Dermatophagoides pteronyssinus TaxID=6956 RepID=A0A6P6YC06_DERPT|nr:uncharacterized protein LOC113796783 [Dermatophagoides pteronyssinus]
MARRSSALVKKNSYYIDEVFLGNFMSFCGEHKISLNAEINCIIGPNGCGKSNLMDAICFGLNLDSKLLRKIHIPLNQLLVAESLGQFLYNLVIAQDGNPNEAIKLRQRELLKSIEEQETRLELAQLDFLTSARNKKKFNRYVELNKNISLAQKGFYAYRLLEIIRKKQKCQELGRIIDQLNLENNTFIQSETDLVCTINSQELELQRKKTELKTKTQDLDNITNKTKELKELELTESYELLDYENKLKSIENKEQDYEFVLKIIESEESLIQSKCSDVSFRKILEELQIKFLVKPNLATEESRINDLENDRLKLEMQIEQFVHEEQELSENVKVFKENITLALNSLVTQLKKYIYGSLKNEASELEILCSNLNLTCEEIDIAQMAAVVIEIKKLVTGKKEDLDKYISCINEKIILQREKIALITHSEKKTSNAEICHKLQENMAGEVLGLFSELLQLKEKKLQDLFPLLYKISGEMLVVSSFPA